MGCEIQKLTPEKAELLTKAVDRQDHGGCLNLTLCRAYEEYGRHTILVTAEFS